jgi:hypothetical protein
MPSSYSKIANYRISIKINVRGHKKTLDNPVS